MQSYPVGWEPDADGFRGHVFATPDNSTVVLSIKGAASFHRPSYHTSVTVRAGTSAPYVGDGGPTIEKDKQNDNLLFSCCCAYIDWTWRTVCGCAKGGWKVRLCLPTYRAPGRPFRSQRFLAVRPRLSRRSAHRGQPILPDRHRASSPMSSSGLI